MDLTLDDGQLALQEELRRFLTNEMTPERRRAMSAEPGGVDRAFWLRLAEMGVFSLTLSEAAGGVGLGIDDATIVFEELGRALVPGPLVATFLAAGFVDGAADGTIVVGAVDRGPEDLVVEHLEALDRILWSGDPATVTDVPRGRLITRPLDPTTPVSHVRATDIGPGDTVDPALRDGLLRHASLLVAAFQVGLAQAAVDLATDYAKSRQQFGRAIGSFQALKHLLADAAAATDIARAGVHAAAVAINEHDDADVEPVARLDVLAAGARIVASRAAHVAATTCIQVHGGMGYTWEVEAHLLLKRSMVLDQSLGGIASAERTVEESL
ncbi:MAG: acyl-CoA dehydrogenase [Acidimicrobiales bacterium]|nr:acyl-CoA dehydrogenase [Acidimicrobiales bacterium]